MKIHKLPKSVSFGQLTELRNHPQATLLAYTIPENMFSDYKIKKYASRKQLENFCKAGSKHHALLKNPKESNLIINRNIDCEK